MRLIDADKLPHKDLSDGKGLCMVVFSQDIAKAPTIDAEPKTGEWIYAKEQLEIVPMWECSCCRTRISKKFNYCPNCGAKMISEDGEKE